MGQGKEAKKNTEMEQEAAREAEKVKRIGRDAVDTARAQTEAALDKVYLAAAADSAAKLAAFELAEAEESGDKQAVKQARAQLRAAKKDARAEHKAANKAAKRSYDAVKFSQPGYLGFLYFIQVVFAVSFAIGVVQMVAIGKDGFDLEPSKVVWLIALVCDAVSFWLIWKRKRVARWWVIGASVFSIVAGGVVAALSGDFSIIERVGNSIWDIFLIVYFSVSRRARITLDEPFSPEAEKKILDEEESYWKPWTWGFWRNLIIYFCVFSVVGHWMEAAVCLLIKYGIVPGTYDPNSQIWSDWLYPFPVYGIGFCACALLLYPLKNFLQRKITIRGGALVLSYVANALTCTLIELILGLTTNQDLQLWDYSNMFCNFMGQVCLQNALFFGLAATTMTWVVYPALERLFRRLSPEGMMGLFVFVVAGFAILMSLYLINPPEAPQQADEQPQATDTPESTGALIARGLTEEEADSYLFSEQFGMNPEYDLSTSRYRKYTQDRELTDEEITDLRNLLDLAKTYDQQHAETKEDPANSSQGES